MSAIEYAERDPEEVRHDIKWAKDLAREFPSWDVIEAMRRIKAKRAEEGEFQ